SRARCWYARASTVSVAPSVRRRATRRSSRWTYAAVFPLERPARSRPTACCSGVPSAFSDSTASGFAFGALENAPPRRTATAARAADHLDAPGLTPPGGSIQTDITDTYAFRSPTSPENTVLVLNVNGVLPGDWTFARGIPGVGHTHPVSYNFNIDNDGDARTDVKLRVRFGAPAADGSQYFEVKRNHHPLIAGESTAFGAPAHIVTHDGVKAFAGRRDDPFFFDLTAFRNNLQFCPGGVGTDFFLGKNVSSIVLELPSRLLTSGPHHPQIGVWTSTRAGHTQIDRMGRPAINTVFLHGDRKNLFNAGKPRND